MKTAILFALALVLWLPAVSRAQAVQEEPKLTYTVQIDELHDNGFIGVKESDGNSKWAYNPYKARVTLDSKECRIKDLELPVRADIAFDDNGYPVYIKAYTKGKDQARLKTVCPCRGCDCDVCLCGFVSAQDEPKKLTRPNKTVTCPNGYTVEFAWHASLKMYCPTEKGWTFCPDDGYWYPKAAVQGWQPPDNSPYWGLTGHAPWQSQQQFGGQFQSASGGCAGGSCGAAGSACTSSSGGRSRVGIFGRRR